MSDSISREDAVKTIIRMCAPICDATNDLVAEINALPSAEYSKPLQTTLNGDLVSREDAFGAVQDHFNADGFKGYFDGQKMMDRIKALPSAEAEQVTGKLNNPCDSLLTDDSAECKEQKSKLGLIRREDAIDAIDDAIDADSPQWAILRTKIGFLPSAEAEWIPCSERLPSEDGCYLVSTTGTNNDIIDIAYYTEGIWHKASRIKAWMPLPKPYREEGEA